MLHMPVPAALPITQGYHRSWVRGVLLPQDCPFIRPPTSHNRRKPAAFAVAWCRAPVVINTTNPEAGRGGWLLTLYTCTANAEQTCGLLWISSVARLGTAVCKGRAGLAPTRTYPNGQLVIWPCAWRHLAISPIQLKTHGLRQKPSRKECTRRSPPSVVHVSLKLPRKKHDASADNPNPEEPEGLRRTRKFIAPVYDGHWETTRSVNLSDTRDDEDPRPHGGLEQLPQPAPAISVRPRNCTRSDYR